MQNLEGSDGIFIGPTWSEGQHKKPLSNTRSGRKRLLMIQSIEIKMQMMFADDQARTWNSNYIMAEGKGLYLWAPLREVCSCFFQGEFRHNIAPIYVTDTGFIHDRHECF